MGAVWTRLAPVLGAEATGEVVRAVPVLLTARGLRTGELDRFGVRMVGRVREVQAAHGLGASGVCDHETWRRLLR